MKGAGVVFLSMLFVLTGLLSATTIEWVTDDTAVDQSWIDLLTGQGYTVNAANQIYRTLDSTKIATLNAADLVIVSRKTGSGDYDDGTEPAQWNALASPVLCLAPHLARQDSPKWKWLPGPVLEGVTEATEIKDPLNSFFWGVPLDENNQVQILASGANADMVNTTSAGNGTLLAVRPSTQQVWIAEWPAGVEYYVGSGFLTGGPRVFLGAGTDVTPGMNLNTAGQQLFLNIVYEMSGATFDRPPFANSGGDHIVYFPDSVQLDGSAPDPDSTPAVTWSQLSGPGTAAFDDASSAATGVSFDAIGTYVLQLEADDGTTVATDTATVYVIDHADDALLAHWDFENLPEPNDLIDVTGNGFDGIYYRKVAGTEPNIAAGHITGSAVAGDFTGGIQYWEIPTSYDDVDPNLNAIATGTTIATWVKAAGSPDYCCPMIVGNGVDGWRLQVNENRWNFAYQPGGIDLYGTYPPFDDAWHNVVAVYDGVNAKAKIYVDGALNVEQDVVPGTLLSKGTTYPIVQVGSRGDDLNRVWTGQIDDIQIYNYPLSDAAIANLASEGDVLPLLTAGEDQIVPYKGVAVPLDATLIVNDGIPAPLALTWSVTAVPGGVDPNDVIFSDKTAEDPSVTFPTVAGTYTLKLTGNDGAVEVSDEVSIVILIPTCEAVLADGLGLAADLSGPAGVPDCYINIYDLAAMAADWLNCNNPEDATCTWPYE